MRTSFHSGVDSCLAPFPATSHCPGSVLRRAGLLDSDEERKTAATYQDDRHKIIDTGMQNKRACFNFLKLILIRSCRLTVLIRNQAHHR